MKKISISLPTAITVRPDFAALLAASSFLGSWVERNGPLHESGVFLDFSTNSAYIRRISRERVTYAGVGRIPITTAGELPPELTGAVLIVPLHKILQTLKWAKGLQADLALHVAENGDVVLVSRNNRITLASEWREALPVGHSPFIEYHNTPAGFIEDIFAATDNVAAIDSIESLGPVGLLRFNPLELDLEVSKLENNIRVVDAKEMPKSLSIGTSTDGRTDVRSVDTDQTYLLSYSRMSMLFKPAKEESLCARAQIYAEDLSTSHAFLQDLGNVFKTIASGALVDEENTVQVTTFSSTADADGDVARAVLISAGHYRFVFTIPSASTEGMAPPSAEDIGLYLPDISAAPSLLSIPFTITRNTLQFWDSLQRLDTKDIITPLKPVEFSFDDPATVTLRVGSSDGQNEASFELLGQLEASHFKASRVPFEQLLRALTAPVLSNDADEDTITFSRLAVDEPAALLIQRGESIALVSEFV